MPTIFAVARSLSRLAESERLGEPYVGWNAYEDGFVPRGESDGESLEYGTGFVLANLGGRDSLCDR